MTVWDDFQQSPKTSAVKECEGIDRQCNRYQEKQHRGQFIIHSPPNCQPFSTECGVMCESYGPMCCDEWTKQTRELNHVQNIRKLSRNFSILTPPPSTAIMSVLFGNSGDSVSFFVTFCPDHMNAMCGDKLKLKETAKIRINKIAYHTEKSRQIF